MGEYSDSNDICDEVPVSPLAAVARRSVLHSILALGVSSIALSACLGGGDSSSSTPAVTVAFNHGVASGDPLSDRVILWTRATPSAAGDLTVQWEISTNANMSSPVNGGYVTTNADRDYTIKIDPTGLSPNTTYYFRFRHGDVYSEIGRTKTLPASGTSVSQIRLALMSCSNFQKGYFNGYAILANLAGTSDEPDVLLHVGDYIYEYGPSGYKTNANPTPQTTDVRVGQLSPSQELLTLEHYRLRYALHRQDADSRAMHRLYPLIAVWDDHETANDSYKSAAENHTEGTEGTFVARRAAAIRAYFEWIPIRGDLPSTSATTTTPIYRSFDFGNLARLMMLDTRLLARDKQLSATEYIGVYTGTNLVSSTPNVTAAVTQTLGVVSTESVATAAETAVAGGARSLLGTEQESWVRAQVAASVAAGQTWQIFGQQILFHYQATPDFMSAQSGLTATQQTLLKAFLDYQFGTGSGEIFAVMGAYGLPNPDGSDSWVGYPTARRRFYDIMATAKNPIILSGDSHNAWCANLRSPTTGAAAGVEFACASITSPGLEEYLALPAPNTLDPAIVGHLFSREDYNGLVFSDKVNANASLSQIVDDMIYLNASQRGFTLVTITPTQATAKFLFNTTVFSRTTALDTTATKTAVVPVNAKAATKPLT